MATKLAMATTPRQHFWPLVGSSARARHIQKKGENSICNRSKSQEIKVATELVTDFQLSVTIKLGEIEGRPYGRPGCNNHCSPVDVGVIVPRRIR